jgi:hypothetical protein
MHQTGITTEYAEPQKVLARKQAIGALTVDGTNVTLCRRTYVRDVRDTLIVRGGYDATTAAALRVHLLPVVRK